MSDCAHCGTSLRDCDTMLREKLLMCCQPCASFAYDTHRLTLTEKVYTRIEEAEKALTEAEARSVIHRTELNKVITKLVARIEFLEQQLAERQAVEDRTLELPRMLINLPHRVDIIERCLPEIEKRLKMRRKEQKALPAPNDQV